MTRPTPNDDRFDRIIRDVRQVHTAKYDAGPEFECTADGGGTITI